ncbi:PrpF domain-containing protein [Halalkalibacter oceani]|uniref:PrpF domain-containing protein n=1 Tax=Halalkalibacter oceani TaxID=1653776 RepID=UPI003393F18F
MTQFSIPCSVYRGGTSRGLFFHKRDLPGDMEKMNRIFLSGIDAYNLSQIDGLGSGTSHTSKVVVIAPSSSAEVDIDYTFYQIGIGREVVDDNGTCGNLMAAVGAFAVNEKLISVSDHQQHADVVVYNTNMKKKIGIRVPVQNGEAKVNGDFLMPGLVNEGAAYQVNILTPGGGKTGRILPLGETFTMEKPNWEKSYELTFVDAVNPFIYVRSEDLGIRGTENNQELSADTNVMERLEAIRSEAAVQSGMVATVEEARQKSPAVPKIAFVAEPHDYFTAAKKRIKREDVDIVARMISMERVHRTFAGSGLLNLAAAVLLPGTLPNRLSRFYQRAEQGEKIIRIGHAEGIVEVRAALTEDLTDIAYVGLTRTARKIMKGELFIPVK